MKSFNEKFPQVQVVIDQMEEAVAKCLDTGEGEEEATHAIKIAQHILGEVADKIKAMKHKPSTIEPNAPSVTHI